MKIVANEIKNGMLLEYKNDLWEVIKIQHVKPGKGGAFNQVEMKNIKNGTKLNERFRSNENLERAIVEEVKHNYIYEDQEKYYFMNTETFDQIDMNKQNIKDKGKMLKENLEVVISFYNEKPLMLNLPNQIDFEIVETEVSIKGQTVSSSYKPAILDNGLKIQVPPFLNIGDKISIDTRTLEYVKKL